MQGLSPYKKMKHLYIGTLFFSGNTLANISSKTAMMPVLSYHSLSFTCPVSFLADHSKSEAFENNQLHKLFSRPSCHSSGLEYSE